MMRERKRRHDDAHFPLQGQGRRATKRKTTAGIVSPLVVNNEPISKTLLGYFRRKCSFFRAIYPKMPEAEIRERAFGETCREWYERREPRATP